MTNLTPHAVRVYRTDGTLAEEFPPSFAVARVVAVNTLDPERSKEIGMPVYRQVTGEVIGLPSDGGPFIVSLAVRLTVPERMDVYSPGEVRMGRDGQPNGCVGLVGNFQEEP